MTDWCSRPAATGLRGAREVPELLYMHLLERYGIRISAVREQLTAALAETRSAPAGPRAPAPMLAIEEIAYDQAGAPTILGWHRASTEQAIATSMK